MRFSFYIPLWWDVEKNDIKKKDLISLLVKLNEGCYDDHISGREINWKKMEQIKKWNQWKSCSGKGSLTNKHVELTVLCKRDIREQGHTEKIKMLSEEATDIWRVLSGHLNSREKAQHTSGRAKDLGNQRACEPSHHSNVTKN